MIRTPSLRRSSVTRRSMMGSAISSPQRARSEERNISDETFEESQSGDDFHHPVDGGVHFVRCDSDPVNAGGDDEDLNDADIGQPQNGGRAVNHRALPTLPRFPIAETKNRNCWSEPSANKSFNVRGKNFFDDKKKIPSGPYVFTAMGADLILTNESSGPTSGIAANPTIFAGHARKVPTFMLNFIFPWGVLVNYFEIPTMYLPYLHSTHESRQCDGLAPIESLAPHERAVIRFMTGTDEQRKNTLKLIPVCVEGPWVVKQMVGGKPAIIGKRLPVEYKYHPADRSNGLAECFEADLDIKASDPVGKKVVNVCRRYMSAVTVDIGIVIEGTSQDELPEQMLGCVRLHRLDALLAPTLGM